MKRKCLLPIIMAAVIMSATAGCSSKKEEAAPPAEEEIVDMEETEVASDEEVTDEAVSDEAVSDEAEDSASEQSTLTGTIDEIKDFMFVVTDSEGRAYAFSFEGDKPKGLDELAVGDEVIVTYTGELSEVDHFDGQILSIEKVK